MASLRRQLISYFPEAGFVPAEGTVGAFGEGNDYSAIVEFGLGREFLHPLTSGKIDSLIGLTGALSELRDGESALCQVIFERCQHPWAETVRRLVSDPSGKPLFVNRPEFVHLAEAKVSKPLYAVVLRMAAESDTVENVWEILRNLAGALRVFAHPNGNEFIPLRNDDYAFEDHLEDLRKRQTRRSGMLLNVDELIGLVHLPSAAVKAGKFIRQATNTKTAPRLVTDSDGVMLGTNLHAGEARTVRLNPDQRTRHLHVIGASGTGKSTFLFNLIQQDITNGQGLAVFDPHGDLIDRILDSVPTGRINDVVLIDPSDESAFVGFNVLSAHSDLEKTLLASDLVSVFRRLSQSWGDQMEGVLRNAILAFLESTQGGTLSDLRRFLLDSKYREKFLSTVQDPDIRFYWERGFTQLSGNKSIGPVLTRLETFLSPKPLRYMVAQKTNKLNFSHILDSGKIFLAKLSEGAIGRENAHLLGSLLMAKFQQTAMSRQRQAAAVRRDFWIYLDEFKNFISPSLGEILTGARKYRIGLVLAHQDLRQLERDREVASAVLSNPYTRVVFRVGDADARSLENGFSSFSARDLQNLGTGEAIVRVERSDYDFNLSVPKEAGSQGTVAQREEVIAASREAYATPRQEVESELAQQFSSEKQERLMTPNSPVAAKAAESKRGPVPESPCLPEATIPEEPSKISVQEISQPKPAEPKTSEIKIPADLGRGGEQHTAIQKRIKEASQKLGYFAATEFDLPDKSGSIDVAILENSIKKFAVEIGITTTIDHEVGNVLKSLRAEFPTVVVISSSEAKLRQMRESVPATVGPELAVRVLYFLPDAFIEYLTHLPKPSDASTPQHPKETVRRGYKVKRSAPKLTPEELKVKESAGIQMLAETMKRKDK